MSPRHVCVCMCVHWVIIPTLQVTITITCTCMHAQSCPALCAPLDYSPPGSPVHEILQARLLKWVAIPPPGDLPNPSDWTWVSYVSCTGRWVLYHGCHLWSPASLDADLLLNSYVLILNLPSCDFAESKLVLFSLFRLWILVLFVCLPNVWHLTISQPYH